MLNTFKKGRFLVLLALSCIVSSSLIAWDECDFCASNRFYVGAFGGGLYPISSEVDQLGTAFFLEAAGGPLAVNAQGRTRGDSTGFGGIQLGYEWAPISAFSTFAIAPAIEMEAYFFKHKKRGDLINPTDRLDEHDFLDTFDLTNDVFLVNGIFSLNNESLGAFSPYLGVGLGATRISIRNAQSLQVEPPEPGINHFNGRKDDSTWAFVAQVKAGLRYTIFRCFHIFGEYRYGFIDSSNYIFGSTIDPVHAATSPWNVKIHNIQYNAFAFGFQYDL